MIVTRSAALGAVLAMAAAPCLAADLPNHEDSGQRRSGATAAAYVKIPLSSERRGVSPQAGLRLGITHDYRSAQTPNARVVHANALDLRLAGAKAKKPTLYLAGKAVTGPEAEKRKANIGTAGTIGLVIGGLAVAALVGYLILIDGAGDE